MKTDSTVNVVIYSRPGCHLCDEAKEAMRAAGCDDEYTLTEINIEDDPELLERYRYDIPVVLINGSEAFRHRLTPAGFRDKILLSCGS
jgi:glutaredoxin